jgi:hypothetical protein
MAAPFQQWLTPDALAALRAAEGTSADTQPPDDVDVTAAIRALETALAGRPPRCQSRPAPRPRPLRRVSPR